MTYYTISQKNPLNQATGVFSPGTNKLARKEKSFTTHLPLLSNSCTFLFFTIHPLLITNLCGCVQQPAINTKKINYTKTQLQ